jgi:glutamyl-tRNA synthetase
MRTRFAPSPTGFLHVGGLRTALYAYLIARQTNGQFLVRIEDTDQERSVEGAVENMLRTLHWAGIHPDEGVMLQDGLVTERGTKGPYTQSQRLEIYRSNVEQLLKSGHAYYAFDTAEEIDALRVRMQQGGNPAPRYDASVRMSMRNSLTLTEADVQARLANNNQYVIRLKVDPARTVTFDDDIRGKVEFRGDIIDDQVLLKSDGFPTYHLAHVVDDHLMDIDIVIRGEEWLSSLPKHILLFEAFGWQTPRYAHVPLLLNKDRSKLSKRQSDVAAEDYIAKGYLPEAMLNFLAMLGWNAGTTQELFSLPELIDQFSLERVQKAGAIFDLEKLDWLQGQWMRRFPLEEFSARIRPLVEAKYPAAADDNDFDSKAALIQERLTYFAEAPDLLGYFYADPNVNTELLANPKQKVTPEMLPELVKALIDTLENVPEAKWEEETIQEDLEKLAEVMQWKKGQVLWPLRAALTGLPFSPGAYEVAAALGKETTLRRLQKAATAL